MQCLGYDYTADYLFISSFKYKTYMRLVLILRHGYSDTLRCDENVAAVVC